MVLKARTVQERELKLVDNRIFFFRQFIRILGINSWEVGILDRIHNSVNSDRGILSVNSIKEETMIKLVIWVAHNELTFKLVHDHENSFMQLRANIDFRIIKIVVKAGFSGSESLCVFICSLCEHQQVTQIDSVYIFD